MNKISHIGSKSCIVTFYHDIEQNFDCKADPDKCRSVVKEFLMLEKKYNISVTYNVVGRLFCEQPDLIDWISEEKQDIAFHSYNHYPNWNPNHYSNEIDLCKSVSSIPHGYRSPRSQINLDAVKKLWENGFLWSAEFDKLIEPYFIYKGLVRLPISADDWPLHLGKLSQDDWIKNFERLLKNRHYVAFGLHDCVASFDSKDRLQAWEKIIQIALDRNALIVNFSEAADLFRRAAVSRQYKFKNSERRQKRINKDIAKKIQEIISIEAKKINEHVIADLSSEQINISYPLKKIANKIYRIINNPPRILIVDSNDHLELQYGEATNSNLNDNSVDFIICADVIEYLFWPEHLIDEIKRIGKNGATCLITFPIINGFYPLDNGLPADRIRHYFSTKELQKLTTAIGPGHFIQVENLESRVGKSKRGLINKMIGNRSYQKSNLTYLIFIGTIQNNSLAKSLIKNIPQSYAAFSFPSQKYERIKISLKHIRSLFPKPIRKMGKWVVYHVKEVF